MCEKVLIWSWVAGSLNVLVPKKRGEGFLRVPYGHHHKLELSAIGDSVESNICGLDGALEFECGSAVYHGGAKARREYADKVIPQLEKHYGFHAKEVGQEEYWEQHPILSCRLNIT